jgi:hypothetical protein
VINIHVSYILVQFKKIGKCRSLFQIDLFVFDHLTLLNLLQPSKSKNTCAFDTVLDIGAGDGYVTETA